MKINQRNENTMMQLILDIARKNDRIRAVIMNGSRASPSAKVDIFQDYDIVYGVTDMESFMNDPHWIDQFGELLILQKPNEMDGAWPSANKKFTYLMQFTDWNRIDLTLLHLNKMTEMHRDSHSILLLDKDNLLGEFEAPSDKDYLPKPPNLTEFQNACNEFLWVSTYVAKGLWRKELTYVKFHSEQVVKEELIKLLGWYAAIRINYEKTIGKSGKYLEQYLEPEIWDQFKGTYVDAEYDHMWEGLFKMCHLFNDVALKISTHYDYPYNDVEYQRVYDYLQAVRKDMKERDTAF